MLALPCSRVSWYKNKFIACLVVGGLSLGVIQSHNWVIGVSLLSSFDLSRTKHHVLLFKWRQ